MPGSDGCQLKSGRAKTSTMRKIYWNPAVVVLDSKNPHDLNWYVMVRCCGMMCVASWGCAARRNVAPSPLRTDSESQLSRLLCILAPLSSPSTSPKSLLRQNIGTRHAPFISNYYFPSNFTPPDNRQTRHRPFVHASHRIYHHNDHVTLFIFKRV